VTSPFFESWLHFDLCLGLTEDLLPVVADHTIAPSPSSQVKALGKVPGRVVASGAVGFSGWTQHRSTPKEIERWSKDERLGLCLQTRHVRALDIDVDSEQAALIADVFELIAGKLPQRYRANSHKHLLAFILEGEVRKRSFKTEHGLVELLGDGQQFIVDSIHPSGERYQWTDGLPESIPVLSADQFERAWSAIVERFALPDTAYEAGATRKRGESFAASDSTAEYLIDNGLVLGEGADGQLYVSCPWVAEHSVDSGITESAWLPAGTSAFECGHYSCLHASCAKRSDEDFREALGIGTSSDFAVIEAPADTPTEVEAPTFQRNAKGQPEAIVNNIMSALECPAWFGAEIALDEFRDEILFTPHGKDEWRPLQDADLVLMRRRFDQRGFKPVGPEMMRSSVHAVARRNRFDSAKRWLDALEWDGKSRIDGFLHNYFGSEDSEYATAVSRYWWTAHAARILYPGCRCDMVPILVSDEGRYKSAGLTAMVPHLDQFVEIDLEHKDADLSRKMRGALLGELAELRGLSGRSAEANKAWVTRRFEEWTPKYIENKQRIMRRLVFVGTTNELDFLDTTTGARRWLPITVGHGDRAKIRSDRDQLWAEARVVVEQRMADNLRTDEDAAEWEGAYLLGEAARINFIRADMWEPSVARWLKTYGSEGEADGDEHAKYRTLDDILLEAIGISPAKASRADQMRIGKILRDCGFTSKRLQVRGVRAVWWWQK
jgi:predicted P-loop ATPase